MRGESLACLFNGSCGHAVDDAVTQIKLPTTLLPGYLQKHNLFLDTCQFADRERKYSAVGAPIASTLDKYAAVRTGREGVRIFRRQNGKHGNL